MARLVLVLGCFLVLAGCGGDPHSRMIGEWKYDTGALKSTDEYKKLSDAEKRMAENMMGAITLKITEDSVTMGKDTVSYTVKEQGDDSITIETTDKKGGKMTVTFRFEGNTMVMTSKNGPPMAFTKKD